MQTLRVRGKLQFIRHAVIAWVALISGGCSSLFYHPSRQIFALPEQYGFEAVDLRFRTQDGILLNGWKILPKNGVGTPSKPHLGTVIQFHGNGENISTHFLFLAWLAEKGFTVVTFDYRGYGKSQIAKMDQAGIYKDAREALRRAYQIHLDGGGGQFITYGQSLGGAVMLRALQDFEALAKVNLIVVESSFSSYVDVARRVLAANPISWIFSPLSYVLVSDEYSAEPSLSVIKNPILFIHDHDDPVVPFGAALENLELSASSDTDLWVFHDGLHVGTFYPGPELKLRQEKFLSYLDRNRSGQALRN